MTEKTFYKAKRLYREGHVHHHTGDTYLVRGDHDRYTVDLEQDSCSCPARVRCSHIGAAAIFEAKSNAETARRMEERHSERSEERERSKRPGVSDDRRAQILAGLDRMVG